MSKTHYYPQDRCKAARQWRHYFNDELSEQEDSNNLLSPKDNMDRHELLIIHYDNGALQTLALTLRESYNVFAVLTEAEALNILKQQNIAVMINYQKTPSMAGMEFLKRSLNINPFVVPILLTGQANFDILLEAVNKDYIYLYIIEPWDYYELTTIVKRAIDKYALAIENLKLRKELQIDNKWLGNESAYFKNRVCKDTSCPELIGHSAAMQFISNLVKRVINNSVTVLLTGETGTGKTLLARYIHHHGPRKDKLFIEQNCGAIPEALLESELFGHKRGAFTGAVQDQKGLFEVADGGTIFLDEISEMSLAMQAKILQVLQEGKFRRVGDSTYRQTNVRIISASNKDLKAEVQKGFFRADLYYRISIFPIHIPPLRERVEDIPLLAENYLKKCRHELNNHVTGFSKEALQGLCSYDYPGNVREMENLIERALILTSGTQVEAGEWLPGFHFRTNPLSTLERLEYAEIMRSLKLHPGNLAVVAKQLGISRTTLWRRLKKYQIQLGDVR